LVTNAEGEMSEVMETDAVFEIPFETEVASPSASWLIFVAALFPLFQIVLGPSVQQAAESAEVSTPLADFHTASCWWLVQPLARRVIS
jgi:hypothetical protein